MTGFVPVHTPAWHTSVIEHALLSLQAGPVKSAHVPFTAPPAATEHASQGPALQAVLQHTPSTHWPLPHWLLVEHATPLVCLGTHAPPLQ